MKLKSPASLGVPLSREQLKHVFGGDGSANGSHVCYVLNGSVHYCTNDPERANEWACQGGGCEKECDNDIAIRECGQQLGYNG